jgi:hypothetical protein
MVEAGLTPTDPARWWLALQAERAEEEDDAGTPEQPDIEVLDP